jgi:hypothetical protein
MAEADEKQFEAKFGALAGMPSIVVTPPTSARAHTFGLVAFDHPKHGRVMAFRALDLSDLADDARIASTEDDCYAPHEAFSEWLTPEDLMEAAARIIAAANECASRDDDDRRSDLADDSPMSVGWGDNDRDRRAESQYAPDMDWCGRFCEPVAPHRFSLLSAHESEAFQVGDDPEDADLIERMAALASLAEPTDEWASVPESPPNPSTIAAISAMLSRPATPPMKESGWVPRHGGGATLTICGAVVVEIEPMGGGWWVGVGDGDLVNGTLQEAKVRALELLSGVGDV